MTDPSSADTPFATVLNRSLGTMIPTSASMNIEAIEVRPGFASMRAPFAGNGNHFGVMYAGVLFTVAELLGGALAWASFDQDRFYPLVKDMQINFRAPARSDVISQSTLSAAEIERISAEALERGKSTYLLEATVTDVDGTVVATTTGTYQLRAHRPAG